MPIPDPESKEILTDAKNVANNVHQRICQMLDEVCDTTDGSPLEVTAAEWYEWQQMKLATEYLIFTKVQYLKDQGKIVVV